jgi:sigma-B regulation protein RsbU (phosphoserine phosphatase)
MGVPPTDLSGKNFVKFGSRHGMWVRAGFVRPNSRLGRTFQPGAACQTWQGESTMGDRHAAIAEELRALNQEVAQGIHQRSLSDEQRYQRLLEAVTSYTYSVALAHGVPISTVHSPSCVQTTGYTTGEYASDAGLWLAMVPPDDWPLVLKQARAACEGTVDGPIEHRIRHKNGSIRWVKSTVVPHRDDTGNVVRYDGIVEDITERKLAQIELETDLQIQKTLKAILEISLEPISLEDMLARVLRTLFDVPFVALESKGAIYLADDKAKSLVIKAQCGLSQGLLGLCHAVPYGCCLCGRAAVEGKVVFADCLDERHERRYSGIKPHGHYCVPIVSKQRVLGLLNLYVRDGHERRETEELFLRSVADTLAGAIERNATACSLRRTQAELIAAEEIQQHLLPQSAPVIPGYDIHGALIPAEFAAGDYFDYLNMVDGSLGLVIGDVTGHGVSSGLFAASVQARIKTLAGIRPDIDEIIREVNASLVREAMEGLFVTTIFVRLDTQTHTLSYVNAGHPSGIVIAAGGRVRSILRSTSIPLAIQENDPFSISGSLSLEPGDTLILLTDGIPEARSRDNELFGTRRTTDILATASRKSARETIASLLDAVHEFAGDTVQHDDMTAVAVKRLA